MFEVARAASSHDNFNDKDRLDKNGFEFFKTKNNLLKIFAAKIGAKFSGCR